MAIARVALATVQNPTSNAAIAPAYSTAAPPDGALMVAIMAAIVQPATMTPPAGWTLLPVQDAGANIRSWVYWRIASGESAGSPYTWTMSSATKCGGVIAAYTGALAQAPDNLSRADTTALATTATPSLAIVSGGWRIDMATGRHATTGTPAAYTYSDASGQALLSFGSNSGTDITFNVSDSNRALTAGTSANSFTSSATESQAVAWSLGLQPAAAGPTIAGRWGVDL